jgi:hypothetical protein
MKLLIESLKRLYAKRKIDRNIIVEMCKNKKISEEEKAYILNDK